MRNKFIKKIFFIFIVLLSMNVFAKDTLDLFFNGELKDVNIIVKDSNTLVPLRFCSEELKAIVRWDQSTQQIMIEKDSNTIVFKLGSLNYTHNADNKSLLVAPILINGVTYIPFRPLVETLNGVVLYNSDHKFINIYNSDTKAYKVYTTLNSQDVIEHRFAMLESPRISNIPDINATSHYYIFPLENPNANYFLEYQGSWDVEPVVSLKYYSIVDGIAVNTWGRQIKQNDSFDVATHPLLKLIGDAKPEDKVEFGSWPNSVDLNYIMFLQNTFSDGAYYLNNVWTDFFALEPSEVGTRATTPFSNKDIILFNIDNKALLEKYRSETH